MARAYTIIILLAFGTTLMNVAIFWGFEQSKAEFETSPVHKHHSLWIQDGMLMTGGSLWQRITGLQSIDGGYMDQSLFREVAKDILDKSAFENTFDESQDELPEVSNEDNSYIGAPEPLLIEREHLMDNKSEFYKFLIEEMKSKKIPHLDELEPEGVTYDFIVRDIERMLQNPSYNDTDWLEILSMPTTGFHSFNHTVSDSIGNFRHKIPDYRNSECKKLNYNISNLPRTSIIIIFHNEARSTLIRTIHAILERTPKLLLEEIIIVDDASTYPWLQEPLKLYLEHLPRTKLIRLESRQGLIRARTRGAEEAKGEVLFFVDAHTEVGYNWLPPLLARIKENRKVLVFPEMDLIDWAHFNINPISEFSYGAFHWNLEFRYKRIRHSIRGEHLENKVLPRPSPVMVGCGHAIERDYFFESGAYDAGMEIWGSENLEHAFRLWMCGGRVEVIPCSRVCHVFKPVLPYSFTGDSQSILQRNSIRTAEVWMDEYKDIFYATQNKISPIDLKTLDERKQIRKKLHCKSFDWYLKNIFPEMPIPPKNAWQYGEIANHQFKSKCIHVSKKLNHLVLVPCDTQEWENHLFNLDRNHQFTFNNTCIVVDEFNNLVLNNTYNPCSTSNQKWVQEKRHIKVSINGAEPLCVVPRSDEITLEKCDAIDKSQIWIFQYTFDFTRKVDIVDIVNRTLTPPSNALHFGAMKNIGSQQCFDPYENGDYDVKDCAALHSYEHITHYDIDGGLRYKNLCVEESPHQDIMLVHCHGKNPVGIWDYEGSNGWMKVKGEDKCLKHSSLQGPKITTVPCSNSDLFQKWTFITQ